MKIGFIGAGNMGSALARAVSKYEGAEIYISDIDTGKLEALTAALGARASSNEEIGASCDYIFLAVKPKFIGEVINGIKHPLTGRDATLVSMAAGVSLASLEGFAGGMNIIRIMPNTPVSVGEGIVLTSANEGGRAKLTEFKSLLSAAGLVEIIDEEGMDAGTALSGCSPAFVYMFIDALAKGAREVGVPEGQALIHAAKTAIGAATLLLESGKSPEELRRAVCSPGGSTIEGVKVLMAEGLEEAVKNAVAASYNKTVELGK